MIDLYVYICFLYIYARFCLLIFCVRLFHPCLSAGLTFNFSFSILFLYNFIAKLYQLYQVLSFPYFIILRKLTVTEVWFLKNLT